MLEDLKTFIRARLDERKKALEARASKKAVSSYSALEMQLHTELSVHATAQTWPDTAPPYEYAAWQYLMADCEVKRRMLDAWADPTGQWSAEQAEAATAMKERMLRILAEEFANHSQYRSEWALTRLV